MTVRLLEGDARAVLATLPDQLVHCCVTSPPYYKLRDYGHVLQIGHESTPQDYIAELVAVFAQVRRVLRPACLQASNRPCNLTALAGYPARTD